MQNWCTMLMRTLEYAPQGCAGHKLTISGLGDSAARGMSNSALHKRIHLSQIHCMLSCWSSICVFLKDIVQLRRQCSVIQAVSPVPISVRCVLRSLRAQPPAWVKRAKFRELHQQPNQHPSALSRPARPTRLQPIIRLVQWKTKSLLL